MDLSELLADTVSSWEDVRPDLDFTAMGTFLRLAQLMKLGLPVLDTALSTHGLNLGEFDVLAALRRGGEGTKLTPTALARVAMVSPGGMTNRLDRLERAGLIARDPDPADRRGSLVTLTSAGRAAADAAIEDLLAAETALTGAMSDTERGRLDRSLDKLLAAIADL